MTKFFHAENQFHIVDTAAKKIIDMLPGGNYMVKQSPNGPFYLEQIENFPALGKIYGDAERNADRIISTFLTRESSTGTLLIGEKGSGKTMLAKLIANKVRETHNIPTIVINAPWTGEAFCEFIHSITQPVVILFDEFEKVYSTTEYATDADPQNSILTLLDGTFPSKKLFIMTCNDRWNLNKNLINRPGRLFYSIEYSGLPTNFIKEYCEDKLINKTHIDKIIDVTKYFAAFNFDMLKALVEEMNRYDEEPMKALAIMNINPQHDLASFKVEEILLKNGKRVDTFDPPSISRPLEQNSFSIMCGKNENRTYHTFNKSDIVSMSGGKIVFKSEHGITITLMRKEPEPFDWRAV